jgi:hypothetical protein
MNNFDYRSMVKDNPFMEKIGILFFELLSNKGKEIFGEYFKEEDLLQSIEKTFYYIDRIEKGMSFTDFTESFKDYLDLSVIGNTKITIQDQEKDYELYSKDFILFIYFFYRFIHKITFKNDVTKYKSFIEDNFKKINTGFYLFQVQNYIEQVFDNKKYIEHKIESFNSDEISEYINKYLIKYQSNIVEYPPFIDEVLNKKDLKKFNLVQRFYILNHFKMLDEINTLDYRKYTHEILAIIMNISIVNARHLINKTNNKLTKVKEKEVLKFLESIK